MSIYALKPAFQHLLRPVTRALAEAGVTANQVTVAAMLGAVAVGAAIAKWPDASWPLILIAPWMLVRMALNAIDGMLAREHGQRSQLGGVLNELGDVVSDTAIYLPFALVPGFDPVLIVIVAILAILTEMTGVVSVAVGGSRRYDGPMGKSDRAFVFAVLGLVAGFGLTLDTWLTWLLWAIVALLALTVVNRARRASRSPDSRQ